MFQDDYKLILDKNPLIQLKVHTEIKFEELQQDFLVKNLLDI
jgi:hypothetical protein